VVAHKTRFIFAHLARNLVHDLVNGSVHIITFGASLKGDVVAAMQNHLGSVTVLLYIQNNLDFDDFRIVKVKARQPASAIFLHRFRDTHMPPSHLDWWICILYLHNGALSILAAENQYSGLSKEEQELRHWNQEIVLAQAGH
jgi:hypothetical protein